MKWQHLLESDPVWLGPRLRKMWVDKLIGAFLDHQKMNPKLTPKDILVVVASDYREEMKEFDSTTTIAISRQVDKTLERMNIRTDWDIPASYQIKAAKIFRDFMNIRKKDKQRRRIPDGMLFKLTFARAFNIKPTHAALVRKLSSDRALREVHKKVLKRLSKLGYDVTGHELDIRPIDIALMRSLR